MLLLRIYLSPFPQSSWVKVWLLGIICAFFILPLPAEEKVAPVATAASEAKRPTSYTLRPRDFIRVGVINEADTFVDRRINPDGTIDVPFLKQLVPVAGMTITDAQEELNKRFRRYFKEPQTVISIGAYAERRVYMSGFVGRPGPLAIPPEESLTLGKALSMAGGILPRGRRSNVAIKRMVDGKLELITKDVSLIDSGEEPDFVLQDEDAVYVDDSRF